MPLIARLVLGRHWRSATEAQRTAYLDAFRVYALDSLAYRFAQLGGGVELRAARAAACRGRRRRAGRDRGHAASRPEPVRIDWRMREADGGYRLIDVAIEGVSLVVSNRSEFDSVVSRQGLDALIAQIRGKSKPGPDFAQAAARSSGPRSWPPSPRPWGCTHRGRPERGRYRHAAAPCAAGSSVPGRSPPRSGSRRRAG